MCVHLCFSLIPLIGAVITINFILLFLTNTFKCFMTSNKESNTMATGFFVVHFRVSRSKYQHGRTISCYSEHVKSKFPSGVSSLLHRTTLARASLCPGSVPHHLAHTRGVAQLSFIKCEVLRASLV